MKSQKKPNIIFLTFDSGRADHMGFMGYPKGTTPFLDSLAQKGIYFKRAFATGSGSPQAFLGMFTSTYPLDHGGYSYIDRPRVIISEAIRAGGYRTIGVHSSPYLSAYFGYDRGWDEFCYATHFRSKSAGQGSKNTAAEAMSPGLRKDTIQAKVLRKSSSVHRWLKKYIPPLAVLFRTVERILLFFRKILKDVINFKPAFYTADEINGEIKRLVPSRPDKPLFLWAHYLDPHVPYALFARKKGGLWLKLKYFLSDALLFLFGDSRFLNRLFLPLYIGLYDESLRYVDEHIKQVFRYFDSLGINADNSVFIVCADHGEAFFEHGVFGHSQMLFNVNLHVPVIFYGPNHLPPSVAVERPVSSIDLAPTILRLAGAEKPDSYKGRDLFDAAEREVVSQASESEGDLSGGSFTGAAIINNGYKLIHWKEERYLFSLEDEAEKNNLYSVKKEIVRDLENRMKKYSP